MGISIAIDGTYWISVDMLRFPKCWTYQMQVQTHNRTHDSRLARLLLRLCSRAALAWQNPTSPIENECSPATTENGEGPTGQPMMMHYHDHHQQDKGETEENQD